MCATVAFSEKVAAYVGLGSGTSGFISIQMDSSAVWFSAYKPQSNPSSATSVLLVSVLDTIAEGT